MGYYLKAEALVRKRILLLPVLIAALLTMSASAAQAGAFVLTLEDLAGGGPVVITDNEVGGLDANLTADKIRFIGTVGSFTVTIFANTFAPGPSGAPLQMNLSNFQVVSTALGGGNFRATLSRTGLSSALLGSSVVGVGAANLTVVGARQRDTRELDRWDVGLQPLLPWYHSSIDVESGAGGLGRRPPDRPQPQV